MKLDVIYNEDCLLGMKRLPDNSVDSVVTDPPYHLTQVSRKGSPRQKGFMGKTWDGGDIAHRVELWAEVFRVLKPGGHLLSFGGSRTYHRMAVAIEDAGFEIRDQIMWVYGSGFPKSLDVGKALDKAAGAFRAVIKTVRQKSGGTEHINRGNLDQEFRPGAYQKGENILDITAPATDAAKQWDGWGTALKPAHEPICLARKPLIGTVAENVLKYGTGALNVNGCRVEYEQTRNAASNPLYRVQNGYKTKVGSDVNGSSFSVKRNGGKVTAHDSGRWPANLILDEEAGELLDQQSGRLVSGASRFFYCAKTSKAERGAGNNHPTVKPLKLMQYLVRLVTPPGGLTLEPFVGSATTLLACQLEGFHYIGFEKDLAYFKIATDRIAKHRADLSSRLAFVA